VLVSKPAMSGSVRMKVRTAAPSATQRAATDALIAEE
jgi:hypothetical protein